MNTPWYKKLRVWLALFAVYEVVVFIASLVSGGSATNADGTLNNSYHPNSVLLNMTFYPLAAAVVAVLVFGVIAVVGSALGLTKKRSR